MVDIKEEDLGLTVVSKEQKFYMDIKDRTVKEIEHLENMLKFNKDILEMCNNKINTILDL